MIHASSVETLGRFRCSICQIIRHKLLRDHSHVTGLDRSYLCRRCNLGLGWIEKALSANDTDRAFRALKKWFRKAHRLAALAYLDRFPQLSSETDGIPMYKLDSRIRLTTE